MRSLWNLATWNQRGDDLAGVNAIAVAGNAGAYVDATRAADECQRGLVSETSASLGFGLPAPKFNATRVVPYCQVDPSVITNTGILGNFNCNAVGIANITSRPPTNGHHRPFVSGRQYYLANHWHVHPARTNGCPPMGGAFFALQNITAGYANGLDLRRLGKRHHDERRQLRRRFITSISSPGLRRAISRPPAHPSPARAIDCGSLNVQIGSFAAYRCKLSLAISCPPGSTTCSGAVTPTTTTAPR